MYIIMERMTILLKKMIKYDKVAQGIIRQLIVIELAEVEELSDTTRGNSGFGSTGK